VASGEDTAARFRRSYPELFPLEKLEQTRGAGRLQVWGRALPTPCSTEQRFLYDAVWKLAYFTDTLGNFLYTRRINIGLGSLQCVTRQTHNRVNHSTSPS